METIIELLRTASDLGFDVSEMLILGALLYFGIKVNAVAKSFYTHESDCKENRSKMWSAINNVSEGINKIKGKLDID